MLFFFFMPLFLAKHGLFFGDYAAADATFRWLCFRLCSIFRGHICPKKAIIMRQICSQEAMIVLLLYCYMVVSGLFTLVFGGDIVFFINLTSSQSVLCC